MRYNVLSLFFVWVCLLVSQQAIAQDKQDVLRRLDFLMMNSAETRKLCSFDVYYENFRDSKKRTNFTAKAIQRVMKDAGTQRVDIADNSDATGFTNAINSLLLLPVYEVFAFASILPVKSDTVFDRREFTKGIEGRDSLLLRMQQGFCWDPCLACLCDIGLFPKEVSAIAKEFYSLNFLEITENQDGTATAVFLGKNEKYGREIVFSKDPDFLPVVVMARAGNTIPGAGKTAKNVEELRRWPSYSTTTTKWKKVSDDLFVPEVIEFKGEYFDQNNYTRVILTNWKFDKDVDQSGLTQESMSNEALVKLQAVELVSRIEKASAKIAKSIEKDGSKE